MARTRLVELARTLDQPFWDKAPMVNAATTNIDYFARTNGTSLATTNMKLANQFSASQVFVARAICFNFMRNNAVAFSTATSINSIVELINLLTFTITKNRVESIDLNLGKIFISPTNAITTGWAAQPYSFMGQKVLNEPILFTPGQEFSAKLSSDGVANTIDATNVSLLITLEGFLGTEEEAKQLAR